MEVVLHTLLCIRLVYPPTTFVRRRAHGVPVYQSRHPSVRSYVSEVVQLVGRELAVGNARRVTVVIKTVDTGLPLERFIFDFGYLGEEKIREGWMRETGCVILTSLSPVLPLMDERRHGSGAAARSSELTPP